MDKVYFTADDFPKIRAEGYRVGIPSIKLFLQTNGFKTIDYEFNDQSNLYDYYYVSEQEYTMLVLRWG